MKGLILFLETKRERFPRLYFVSNEELVEIFSKGKETNHRARTSFMKNLFEGVHIVLMTNAFAITNMISKEGENIKLIKAINTGGISPDRWLS